MQIVIYCVCIFVLHIKEKRAIKSITSRKDGVELHECMYL